MKTTKKGVVAEFNGMYWGVEYEDGHCCCYNFVTIDKAKLSNPEFCKRPTDMTYKGSSDTSRLAKATLKHVTITTTYDIHE